MYAILVHSYLLFYVNFTHVIAFHYKYAQSTYTVKSDLIFFNDTMNAFDKKSQRLGKIWIYCRVVENGLQTGMKSVSWRRQRWIQKGWQLRLWSCMFYVLNQSNPIHLNISIRVLQNAAKFEFNIWYSINLLHLLYKALKVLVEVS